MLNYDFENSVGVWLHDAWHHYQRALNDELEPQGITLRQAQVLGWLALAGPLSQSELAERMRIEPPTLVGILDRMERDGWLRRRPCPQDRRRKLISPQAAARPVWRKIVACARRVRSRATRGMTKSETATLFRLLGKVKTNLADAKREREAS